MFDRIVDLKLYIWLSSTVVTQQTVEYPTRQERIKKFLPEQTISLTRLKKSITSPYTTPNQQTYQSTLICLG